MGVARCRFSARHGVLVAVCAGAFFPSLDASLTEPPRGGSVVRRCHRVAEHPAGEVVAELSHRVVLGDQPAELAEALTVKPLEIVDMEAFGVFPEVRSPTDLLDQFDAAA